MDNKGSKSAGRKTLGKIFLVFTAAVALAAMIFAAYMGGQKKVIEKYYTSVVRDDEAGVRSCLSADTAFPQTTGAMIKGSLGTETGIVHVRVDFEGRQMYSLSEADYYYTVNFYDDNKSSYTSSVQKVHIVRNGMEWKLAETDPPGGFPV